MIAVTVDEFGVWSAPRVTLSAAAAKLAGETEARSSGATVAEKLTLKLRGAKGGGCEGGGGVYPPSGAGGNGGGGGEGGGGTGGGVPSS